jgi:excinuclease UvrABC nuclease subunit
VLSEIPGVGAKTAQKLLKEFGSVVNIQRAGLEKLSSVVSRKSAEKILSQLGESKAP